MSNLYARAVFFVENTERALHFYVEQLGFSEDWSHPEDGRVYVCQVSLFGFELILNQVTDETQNRAGHGRVFIGLEDDQIESVRNHIATRGIPTERRDWGQPTLVMKDMDGNEIFFWDWPEKESRTLELTNVTAPAQ
jgi:catechol 2,3-dioxygenase-like lactoylglutathione lyase family enzyme